MAFKTTTLMGWVLGCGGGGAGGGGGEEREVGGGVGRGVRLLSIRIMAFISA